jgi:hypothetical protein
MAALAVALAVSGDAFAQGTQGGQKGMQQQGQQTQQQTVQQQNGQQHAVEQKRSVQQSGDRRTQPPVLLLSDWNYDAMYRNGWSARELMDDASVYGPGGDEIGSVENIVLGPDGKVLGIVAQVGGFLDIGDTHVFVPWSRINVSPDLERVTIPISEENVEEYSTWADAYLRKAETGRTQVVDSDLATGPRAWKATELIGDDAFMTDYAGYGGVRDLIFTQDGNLHAVVVNAYAGYGGGYRAFPYYGYSYGWNPSYSNYYLGYGPDEVAELPAFDYDEMNDNVAMQGQGETTGSSGGQRQTPDSKAKAK